MAAESTKFASRNAQDLARALLDLHGERLSEMNANGVEFAIMSQNTPGPQGITDSKEAAEYAVRSNNYIADLVGQAPERFAAFGVVSMHDPDVAVVELTRLILGHLGEMLLGHLGRIDHWLEKRNRGKDLPSRKTVRECLETNVYVTTAGHFATPALIHATTEIGVDRVLFSVDTPFENITEGATWVDTLPISHGDVAKIGRTNALKLFPRLSQRLRSEQVGGLQQNRERILFTTNAGFQ